MRRTRVHAENRWQVDPGVLGNGLPAERRPYHIRQLCNVIIFAVFRHVYNPWVLQSADRYLQDLHTAEKKLDILEAQRDELDLQIAVVKKEIIHLGALTHRDETRQLLADIGLSAMCEIVMRWAGSPLTPVKAKRLIADFGYDIESHSNPLASIHTTLKRMEKRGKLKAVRLKDGSIGYTRIIPRDRIGEATVKKPRHQR